MTYRLYKAGFNATEANAAYYTNEAGQTISFLFDPANTDYQQFVRDIKNGVVLNDAEGNPITGDSLTTFIASLP